MMQQTTIPSVAEKSTTKTTTITSVVADCDETNSYSLYKHNKRDSSSITAKLDYKVMQHCAFGNNNNNDRYFSPSSSTSFNLSCVDDSTRDAHEDEDIDDDDEEEEKFTFGSEHEDKDCDDIDYEYARKLLYEFYHDCREQPLSCIIEKDDEDADDDDSSDEDDNDDNDDNDHPYYCPMNQEQACTFRKLRSCPVSFDCLTNLVNSDIEQSQPQSQHNGSGNIDRNIILCDDDHHHNGEDKDHLAENFMKCSHLTKTEMMMMMINITNESTHCTNCTNISCNSKYLENDSTNNSDKEWGFYHPYETVPESHIRT